MARRIVRFVLQQLSEEAVRQSIVDWAVFRWCFWFIVHHLLDQLSLRSKRRMAAVECDSGKHAHGQAMRKQRGSSCTWRMCVCSSFLCLLVYCYHLFTEKYWLPSYFPSDGMHWNPTRSIPHRVKPLNLRLLLPSQVLARFSALLWKHENWLDQRQGNLTEGKLGSWCS